MKGPVLKNADLMKIYFTKKENKKNYCDLLVCNATYEIIKETRAEIFFVKMHKKFYWSIFIYMLGKYFQ